MAISARKKARCIVKGCSKEVASRGLCAACRSAAARMIENGETTEEELIERGLMLPNRQGHRPDPAAIRVALEKSRG